MPDPLVHQCPDSPELWDNGNPRSVDHRRDPSGHPGGAPDFSGNGLPGHPSRHTPGFLSGGPPCFPGGDLPGFPSGSSQVSQMIFPWLFWQRPPGGSPSGAPGSGPLGLLGHGPPGPLVVVPLEPRWQSS